MGEQEAAPSKSSIRKRGNPTNLRDAAQQGQWAAAKHGKRGIQGWRKLHLAVDGDGSILAQCTTLSTADDATTGIDLLRCVGADIKSIIADGAYDRQQFYLAGQERRADVIVPPIQGARVQPTHPPNRNLTIESIEAVSRRQWMKDAGYHRQSRAENAIFRFKTIIGHRFRSRSLQGQEREARRRASKHLTNKTKPSPQSVRRPTN